MSGISLPVLMYHYISRYKGATAVSPEHFEDQCKGMAQAGWRGIGLTEAEAFLRDGAPLPPRSVLITFDDGYLDNYVYAWPILQKYGHQGVVFAVTERLETSPLLRPTLHDVWAGANPALPPVDAPMHTHSLGFAERRDLFFSWEEARHMEQSKVMSVAAHSARHLAVFAGSQWALPDRHARADLAQRFHIPGTRTNTFYQVDAPTVWGLPRFKERPALYARAHLPCPELVAAIRRLVPQEVAEARAFFQNPLAVAELEALLATWPSDRLVVPETDAMRHVRIQQELTLCATTLRRELGHPVASLCWPWGSGSSPALDEGQKQGFSVYYTTKMGANPPASALAVHRFKVRDTGWNWLKLRLELYSHPWLAHLYAACRL
ncbi:MAG: polysaccharide deacetylase family protein [Bilophila sp.]